MNTFISNTSINTRHAGWALILGSFLITITMVLHPVAGSFEHLIQIATMAMIVHSIALVSIPILFFGYLGLTSMLRTNMTLSLIALSTMTFGLIAVSLAATVNGLVLPLFINRFANAGEESLEVAKMILAYNTSLNHAFDYIYIVSAAVGIVLWSVVMWGSSRNRNWVALSGIILALLALIALFGGFVFTDLHGFRSFIFGLVLWNVLAAFVLIRS